MDDSYEALRFDPLYKQRFDEYCRSASDRNPVRIYLGTWMLKLAIAQFYQPAVIVETSKEGEFQNCMTVLSQVLHKTKRKRGKPPVKLGLV